MLKAKILNWLIQLLDVDTNLISDGFHTFGEMYKHRIHLMVALMKEMPEKAWRSRKHADGIMYPGWFIAGINTTQGQQISYHLGEEYWDFLEGVQALDKAPKWDKHTPNDVLDRLLNLRHFSVEKEENNG